MLGSATWTFGTMAALGEPMTMLSNILPAFIVCVGVGDSIHLQSVYRDLRRAGTPNQEAIVAALSTTGVPMFFTTLTTMFGLIVAIPTTAAFAYLRNRLIKSVIEVGAITEDLFDRFRVAD